MKVTPDDIAQLLASPPPRKVPPAVERAALGGGAGCFAPGFGLVFGAFGMIFVFFFFPWRLVDEIRLASGAATARGEIRGVTETNMSINETKVQAYLFAFTAADRREVESTCYTTGQRWSEGAGVTVRYLRHRPEVACVEGARLSEGGWFGLFTLIFPVIGFGMFAAFFVGRRITRRLLREGHMAEVDILAVDETSVRVNKRPLYRITLANPAIQGGQPIVMKRTDRADVDLALKHLREKQPVFVLYDPRKPARIIMPEGLIAQ